MRRTRPSLLFQAGLAIILLCLPLLALAQEGTLRGVSPGSAAVAPEEAAPAPAPAAPPEVAAPVAVPETAAPALAAPASPKTEVPAAEPAPPPSPSWLAQLWDVVGAWLLTLIGAVLAALAAWVLRLLAAKIGVDLILARGDAVREAVASAIWGAEEWAARRLKAGSPPPESRAKLQWVVDAVKKQWPDLIDEDLHRMIDEELGRAVDIGASKLVGEGESLRDP